MFDDLVGATQGLIQGVIIGDTAKSVLGWASFGAVFGFGAGAYEKFDEDNQ